LFKKFAGYLGKTWFWVENTILILIITIYEILLIPIILLKLFYALFITTNFFLFLVLGPLWVVFGWVYLFILAFIDVFNFIRVLSDYKDEGE